MDNVDKLRNEVKKYVDTADEKVLKIVHAMLELNADEEGWWDNMPDEIKTDVEEAIKQGEKGEVLSHSQVIAKYPQWFTK